MLLLGTEWSGTGESRMTIVLPLRHPRQPSDIFHLPPTPCTLGLCASLSAAPAPLDGTHERGWVVALPLDPMDFVASATGRVDPERQTP